MDNRVVRALGALAVASVVAASVGVERAAAHPHVFVKVETRLVAKDGALVGLRHTWIFDETWLANQILEHDKDGDGKLSAAELVPLTTESKATLEMFRSFTVVRAGGTLTRVVAPRDLAFAYRGAGMGLTFTVSLAKPVPLANLHLTLLDQLGVARP